MELTSIMLYVLNSTTNPGQLKTVKESFCGPLKSRGQPKDHLAVFGCPKYVVEFKTYSIMKMIPKSFAPLLKDGLQLLLLFP